MEAGTHPSVDALERLLYTLSALGEMAEQMTSNPNPTSSIRAILRMTKGAFAIGEGALLLFKPDEHALELVTEALDDRRVALDVPADARRYFLAEAGTLLTGLEEPHPALESFVEGNAEALAGLPGMIWLPLSVNRHFLGLLMLGETVSAQPLSQTELDILTLMGRQLAVALHNFQLNTSLKSANLQLGLKVRQLEQLFDISREISSSLDRSRIMRELVVRTIELLDARKGMLLTLGEGAQLEGTVMFGFDGLESPPRFPALGGWLEGVLEDRTPYLFEGELPEILQAETGIAVPVAYQDRLFGVLAVFDKETRDGIEPFGDEDVPLLVNLAGQAATAIENARLYELATVDGLTKLFIRRHFEQRLGEELRRATRYDGRASLMIMDIDHFKKFNDTYGHAVGDEVLKLVARTIKASVREELDIPARYGGEEMMVLMPETDTAGAHVMAERVRSAIENASMTGPNGEALRVTVSIGVATFPTHAATEDELLEVADKALYRSKAEGRNRTTVCQDPVAPQSP